MRSTSLFSRSVIWLIAIMTILPFLLALMTSFKTQAELFQGAFTLPGSLQLGNYLSAWREGHFNVYFLNSVIVVIPVIVISIFAGILSGFGFAFCACRGKNSWHFCWGWAWSYLRKLLLFRFIMSCTGWA